LARIQRSADFQSDAANPAKRGNDRKMKDRNTGLGIIEEMLIKEQREAVKIFLPYIFLS